MNIRELNLLPEERLLFQTRKHWMIFLPAALLTLICPLFLFSDNPFLVKFTFLPAIAALLYWLNAALTYITSFFAVTDKRVILREGFFFKHMNEMRLTTIANISVNQSLLGQVLNYGTLIIFPFGGNPDPFTQIAQPNEFMKVLQLQLQQIDKKV